MFSQRNENKISFSLQTEYLKENCSNLQRSCSQSEYTCLITIPQGYSLFDQPLVKCTNPLTTFG